METTKSNRFSDKPKFDDICVKCGADIVGFVTRGLTKEDVESVVWSRGTRPDGLATARWHVRCSDLPDSTEAVERVRARISKYADKKAAEKTPETSQTPTHVEPKAATEKTPVTTSKTGDSFLEGMATAIAPYLDGKLKVQADELSAELEAKIKAAVSAASKVIVIKNEITGEVKNVGRQHEKFPKLLKLIRRRKNVYLFGAPGSGKSTVAIKAAEALSMNHGYISLSAQTAESRVIGFVDANGTFRDTEFVRCYQNGGVFCIDEMDNASANLLTALNSALANGKAAFPCGNVDKHPDFILVATGNTAGYGANPMFPERRPMDAAFRERFFFLDWPYDEGFERDLALGQNDTAGKWIDWVQQVRKFAATNYPKLLVSPRASIEGASMMDEFEPVELAEMLIFKGFDKDSVARVVSANPLPRF